MTGAGGDDPGWGSLGQILTGVVVPGLAVRRRGGDGLVTLRAVFVSFAIALVLIGVVTTWLTVGSEGGGGSALLPMAGVAVVGISVHVAARVITRELDCQSDEALAESYRSRFFLRIALFDSAALVGFVTAVVSGSVAPYAVGLAFAAAGFLSLAPTRGHLEADQHQLALSGCSRSLVAALRADGGNRTTP